MCAETSGGGVQGLMIGETARELTLADALALLRSPRVRAITPIVVGAGTVAADDPQLTTRQVAGPNPVRVIFDPKRRLDAHYRVFTDAAVRRAEKALDGLRPLHFPVVFPQVFLGARGGFDCIIGNPPWTSRRGRAPRPARS